MHIRSKIQHYLLTLLILISLLVACQGGEGEKPTSLSVTITFACPEYQENAYRDLADQFEAANPDVRVQVEALAPRSDLNQDALNLGAGEFRFGRPFLEEQRRRVSFPFLSANLVDPDSGERPYAAYAVEEAGHLKVGVIGLVSPKRFQGRELAVQDPLSALQAILPEVERKAHLLIMLAQMSRAEATELLRRVESVDVMVLGGGTGPASAPLEVKDALLVQCVHWGMAAGELQITGNTDGQVVDYRWRSSVLDERVADDPQVVELMQRYGE